MLLSEIAEKTKRKLRNGERGWSILDAVREEAAGIAGDEGMVATRGETAAGIADHPESPDEVVEIVAVEVGALLENGRADIGVGRALSDG